MRFVSLMIVAVLGVMLVQAQDKTSKPEKPEKPAEKPAEKPGKPGEKPAPQAEKPGKPPADAAPGEPRFSEEPLLLRDADKPTDKDFREFRTLVTGAATVGAEHKALINKMAKWMVYRLTWTEIQEGRDAVTIHQVMHGKDGALVDGVWKAIVMPPKAPPVDNDVKQRRERQRVYMQELKTAIIPHVRQVLKNRLIARVNAVQVLVWLVEAGHEDVADELIKIIENPEEHEAVRFVAFQGLRKFFDQGKEAKDQSKEVKRIESCGLLLCKALERRCELPPDVLALVSPPEVEAVRYVRRELIRGLGAAGRPLIVDVAQKEQKRREGPAAELLLRVLNNSKMSPEASWQERTEAAAALFQLKHKSSPSYQPDFAIHEIGRYVSEMAAEAANNPATQRWKYFASLLRNGTEEALKDLAEHPTAAKHLRDMMVIGNRVLDAVFNEKNVSENAELNRWLNENKPKASAVYSPG